MCSSAEQAVMPKPRFAIERALSTPHDYLNCTCCASGPGVGLSPTHPSASILYQLYLECGVLINTADLWSAFQHMVCGEDGQDCDADTAK
jgi:origin recognition complex subunit 3